MQQTTGWQNVKKFVGLRPRDHVVARLIPPSARSRFPETSPEPKEIVMMNKTMTSLALAAALTLSLAGSALAESQYGYNSTGTGTVTATAHVTLSVTVPKLILLRVGANSGTISNLGWTTSLSIPGTPTVPTTTASNVPVDWTGAAPTSAASTNPAGLAVFAWTNNPNGGQIAFTATAFGTGGPTLANIGVTAAGSSLAHPGANLGVTGATTNFTALTAASDTWNYALSGTPGGWLAGAYSSTVTYTATSI